MDDALKHMKRREARWDAALQEAIRLIGGKLIALYLPSAFGLGFHDTMSFWIATDVALGEVGGTSTDDNLRLIVDWTPWQDVINPEVRTEVTIFDGEPVSTIRLLIQLPRVEIESSRRDQDDLTAFANAVLRLAKGR